MPIKSNVHYNDPDMAQAAANLSTLFAPTSGSDMSGYAAARAKDMEANQRKALWDYYSDPAHFDADKLGVTSDLYDPTQSYYAVDQNNQTQRYGYDQSLAGTKYTADQSLIGTKYNTDVDAETAIKEALLTPVAKDATRFVPPAIATEANVPTLEQGNIGAAQGETIYKPDGGVVQGTPKPLSETEVKGDMLSQMIAAAEKSNDPMAAAKLARQAILGTDVEQIVGPKGPEFISRSDAAGREPYNKPTGENAPQVDDYIALGPDGQTQIRFVGYFDPQDKKVHNSETGAVMTNVIQKGIGSQALSIHTNPDGSVDITQGGTGTRPPNEVQSRAGFAASMSEPAVKDLVAAFNDPATLPTMQDYLAFQGRNYSETSDNPLISAIGGIASNAAMSDSAQKFYANLRTLVPLELFTISGQAVPETEYKRLLGQLTPLPNDSPGQRAVKLRQIELYHSAVADMATGKHFALDGPENAALQQEAAKAATDAPAATSAAPAPQTAPAATPGPAEAAPAAADPDRAASIANAKAAVAAGKDSVVIEQKLRAAYPDLKPAEWP